MGVVSDIFICPVDFTVQNKSSAELDSCLVQLVAYTVHGELVEALYRHHLGGFGSTKRMVKEGLTLPLPRSAMSDLSQSARFIFDDGLDDLDDFVVADDTEEEHTDNGGNALGMAPLGSDARELPVRNWKHLLEHDILQGNKNDALTFELSLHQATERFEQLQMAHEMNRMCLMSDLVKMPRVVDVEQDSEFADLWLDNLESQGAFSVERISDMHSAGLQDSAPPSLLRIYDDLMSAYIESLGPQVIDRNRVNRERLVRQIASDVFLGNLILRQRKILEVSKSPNTEAVSDQIGPQGDEPERPSVSQSPQPSEEPAVSRLRRYASFRHEVPPLLLSNHARISQILEHIPEAIEEDPAQYSYQQTNQKLKLAQEEMATQSLDPRERRKAVRQASRLQRKLEKTAQISREVMSQRSVLPGITSVGARGGFTLPGRDIQSSQLAGPASSQSQDGVPGLTMTQPERGVFGTRPVKKKGKEKAASRKAGF